MVGFQKLRENEQCSKHIIKSNPKLYCIPFIDVIFIQCVKLIGFPGSQFFIALSIFHQYLNLIVSTAAFS